MRTITVLGLLLLCSPLGAQERPKKIVLIAGPLEIPFGKYLAVSFVGRILRYLVIAPAPLLF